LNATQDASPGQGAKSVESLFQTVDARFGRITFFANDTGALAQSLRSYGEWAQNELAFIERFLTAGSTVVDVGAYVGTHTLAFAHLVGPNGRVVSIEPQNESFALLSKNVAANGIKNVQLEHAAAADLIGVVHGQAIRITESESFGSAALRRFDASVKVSEQTDLKQQQLSVRTLTIDSLDLGSCALIKIDAEGFEDLVILGARRTMQRLRPVIYAECNSVASGIRISEAMRNSGYIVYMHVVDAFNRANFFGATENIFGRAREAALVGVSPKQSASLDQMDPRPCELILKIETADDLVLGMLNKPQYAGEVLEVGRAARTGGDVWIKEATLLRNELDQWRQMADEALREAGIHRANLKAAVAECDRARQELDALRVQREAALGQRDQAHQEAAALRAQLDAAMLQARFARQAADEAEERFAGLSERCRILSASVSAAHADLENAAARISELERRLTAMQNSRSWRMTSPLRAIRRQLRKMLFRSSV